MHACPESDSVRANAYAHGNCDTHTYSHSHTYSYGHTHCYGHSYADHTAGEADADPASAWHTASPADAVRAE